MDEYDEILAPQSCARCGRAFSPPPDTWVFCPSCRACHIGLAVPPNLRGAALARAWLKAFTGDAQLFSGGGYTMHRTEGRLYILHGAVVAQAAEFSALVEHGERDQVTGSKYVVLRLAGFPPSASAAAAGPWMRPSGQVVSRRWGLELITIDAGQVKALRADPSAALHDMAYLAKGVGYEPVLESGAADVATLPDEVSATLKARQERAVRCNNCGAPVAPVDLGASPRCPYCLSEVDVPEELANELHLYRRQLQAQDAQYALQGASLWGGRQLGAGNWLACAVCGSPRAHQPGVVDEACEHCGAMIVPSAQRLQGDVGSAREALEALANRRRLAARAEAERGLETTRQFVRLNAAMFTGSLLLTTVMSIAPFVLALTQDYVNILGVVFLILSLGSLPAAALAYGIYSVRRNRRQDREWGPVWAGIAEQLDGVVSTQPTAWLTRFWTAAVPRTSTVLQASRAKGAVEAVHDQVPVMIVADVEGDVGPIRKLYNGQSDLRIYVAVEWPESVGILKATRGIKERRRELQAAGFSTCVRRRGFELRASQDVLRRLRDEPSQTVRVVPVLFEALRIVKLLGGRAVSPLSG